MGSSEPAHEPHGQRGTEALPIGPRLSRLESRTFLDALRQQCHPSQNSGADARIAQVDGSELAKGVTLNLSLHWNESLATQCRNLRSAIANRVKEETNFEHSQSEVASLLRVTFWMLERRQGYYVLVGEDGPTREDAAPHREFLRGFSFEDLRALNEGQSGHLDLVWEYGEPLRVGYLQRSTRTRGFLGDLLGVRTAWCYAVPLRLGTTVNVPLVAYVTMNADEEPFKRHVAAISSVGTAPVLHDPTQPPRQGDLLLRLVAEEANKIVPSAQAAARSHQRETSKGLFDLWVGTSEQLGGNQTHALDALAQRLVSPSAPWAGLGLNIVRVIERNDQSGLLRTSPPYVADAHFIRSVLGVIRRDFFQGGHFDHAEPIRAFARKALDDSNTLAEVSPPLQTMNSGHVHGALIPHEFITRMGRVAVRDSLGELVFVINLNLRDAGTPPMNPGEGRVTDRAPYRQDWANVTEQLEALSAKLVPLGDATSWARRTGGGAGNMLGQELASEFIRTVLDGAASGSPAERILAANLLRFLAAEAQGTCHPGSWNPLSDGDISALQATVVLLGTALRSLDAVCVSAWMQEADISLGRIAIGQRHLDDVRLVDLNANKQTVATNVECDLGVRAYFRRRDATPLRRFVAALMDQAKGAPTTAALQEEEQQPPKIRSNPYLVAELSDGTRHIFCTRTSLSGGRRATFPYKSLGIAQANDDPNQAYLFFSRLNEADLRAVLPSMATTLNNLPSSIEAFHSDGTPSDLALVSRWVKRKPWDLDIVHAAPCQGLRYHVADADVAARRSLGHVTTITSALPAEPKVIELGLVRRHGVLTEAYRGLRESVRFARSAADRPEDEKLRPLGEQDHPDRRQPDPFGDDKLQTYAADLLGELDGTNSSATLETLARYLAVLDLLTPTLPPAQDQRGSPSASKIKDNGSDEGSYSNGGSAPSPTTRVLGLETTEKTLYLHPIRSPGGGVTRMLAVFSTHWIPRNANAKAPSAFDPGSPERCLVDDVVRRIESALSASVAKDAATAHDHGQTYVFARASSGFNFFEKPLTLSESALDFLRELLIAVCGTWEPCTPPGYRDAKHHIPAELRRSLKDVCLSSDDTTRLSAIINAATNKPQEAQASQELLKTQLVSNVRGRGYRLLLQKQHIHPDLITELLKSHKEARDSRD